MVPCSATCVSGLMDAAKCTCPGALCARAAPSRGRIYIRTIDKTYNPTPKLSPSIAHPAQELLCPQRSALGTDTLAVWRACDRCSAVRLGHCKFGSEARGHVTQNRHFTAGKRRRVDECHAQTDGCGWQRYMYNKKTGTALGLRTAHGEGPEWL